MCTTLRPSSEARMPIFALPDRLSHKSTPALTDLDERHLRRVVETVQQQVRALSSERDELRRSPAGRGRKALDRDLEIHRLTARLAMLARFSTDLCLGRMVPADGSSPVWIGRIGLTTGDGEQLLVDWRTPAAEPFFAATAAHPSGLVSRRRYRWSGGVIVDYWDESFGQSSPGQPAVALDDDSAFIASLGSSRSPRMRDVLATIQADQDAIIRADSSGPLVVDGGPGTGKTVVALHRAAYLLHTDPRLAGSRGSLAFVGPHEAYLGYVADVLPALGEDGVLTCTLADLLGADRLGVDGPVDEDDPRVAALKHAARLVEAVEPAVAFHEQPPSSTLVIDTDWGELRLTPDDWREAIDALEPGTPHNEARDDLWQALLTIAVDQLVGDDEGQAADELTAALADDDDLAELMGATWPMLDATDVVSDLWSVPAYLRLCAPWLSTDERALLRRDEGSPWTSADLPLLDAVRARLGDRREAGRRHRAQATLAADRAYMDDVVTHLLEADDDPESGLGLLRRDSIRDDLLHTEAVATATRDRLAGPFAHVIVDEAQELTDAQWQVILRRCPSRSITVVGDRAQARSGFGQPGAGESWASRLERVGLGAPRLASLTVNYRTPQEVMAAAAPVILAALPDANVPTSVRVGGRPVRRGSVGELDEVLRDWLAAHDEGTAVVIGRQGAEPATTAHDGRVSWHDPVSVKGLEFDLVVLLDRDWPADLRGAVDRYVAMTRATQELVLLS
ncbi:RNA polymerase recycling motor ATPase HelR [Aestuariimicrobium soli]|uniref:RNA polymerase recycling motor ATPase HelR n=1 Tax=Aestuariimicrobium soli TaxID=2035834 RepID=UPI003EBC01F6